MLSKQRRKELKLRLNGRKEKYELTTSPFLSSKRTNLELLKRTLVT